MTAPHYLYAVAIALIAIGCEPRVMAEGDVTIIAPAAATTNAAPQKPVAPDGTPVVHKSLHKKKKTSTTAVATTSSSSSGTSTAIATSSTATVPSSTSTATPKPTASPASVVKNSAASPAHVAAPAPSGSLGSGPTVETGLPIARHTGSDDVMSSVLIPKTVTVQSGLQDPPAYHAMTASYSPEASASSPTSVSSNYSSPVRSNPGGDFVFTNYNKKPKSFYPWKTSIITTIFWIGEGGSTISPTDNIGSAWDEDWRINNRGNDDPNDRSGFGPASHAPTLNTFYVALPFNDLAYPDKAARWLPAGWHRPNKDGKQVSACKDRWVQIKNAQGRSCYAQWEDVGPLRSDHAEYVFGDERPDTYTRAGLDVSPAVAQYLGLGDKNHITSWRFVDEEDVPPGFWLKYDEEALLYKALHEQKFNTVTPTLPIQRAAEPVDDPLNYDANKQKVGAAKG